MGLHNKPPTGENSGFKFKEQSSSFLSACWQSSRPHFSFQRDTQLCQTHHLKAKEMPLGCHGNATQANIRTSSDAHTQTYYRAKWRDLMGARVEQGVVLLQIQGFGPLEHLGQTEKTTKAVSSGPACWWKGSHCSLSSGLLTASPSLQRPSES